MYSLAPGQNFSHPTGLALYNVSTCTCVESSYLQHSREKRRKRAKWRGKGREFASRICDFQSYPCSSPFIHPSFASLPTFLFPSLLLMLIHFAPGCFFTPPVCLPACLCVDVWMSSAIDLFLSALNAFTATQTECTTHYLN